VDGEHGRVTAEGVRINGRPSEDFGEIRGQVFQVLGMTRMREGMIKFWIFEAAFIEGTRQCEERGVATRNLENGSSVFVHRRFSGERFFATMRI